MGSRKWLNYQKGTPRPLSPQSKSLICLDRYYQSYVGGCGGVVFIIVVVWLSSWTFFFVCLLCGGWYNCRLFMWWWWMGWLGKCQVEIYIKACQNFHITMLSLYGYIDVYYILLYIYGCSFSLCCSYTIRRRKIHFLRDTGGFFCTPKSVSEKRVTPIIMERAAASAASFFSLRSQFPPVSSPARRWYLPRQIFYLETQLSGDSYTFSG